MQLAIAGVCWRNTAISLIEEFLLWIRILFHRLMPGEKRTEESLLNSNVVSQVSC
jgi:hypothetical protein